MAASSYRPMAWFATTVEAGTEASCRRTSAISVAMASSSSSSYASSNGGFSVAPGRSGSSGTSPEGVHSELTWGTLTGA
jgi:hypothetical protein